MKKRRERQVNLATEAEIIAINSTSLAGQVFVSTDTSKQYWIDNSGLPLLISSGTGGANLSIGTQTSTTLDINSDSGTNATIPQSVSGGNAGLQSGTDKAKLDGISTGATANDTDANLKNRANHTGTQTASTISDFDAEVSNNSSVTANTAKVSASGSINTHSDVDDSGKSENDRLYYNGTNWVPRPKDWIYYYLSTGGTTSITTTAKAMTFNNTGEFSTFGHYSRAGTVVTVNDSRMNEITVDVGLESSTTSRSKFEIYMEHNGTEVPGTRAPIYVRGYSQGSSGTINCILDLTATDTIEVFAIRISGASAAYQVDNASRLKLKQL